MLNKDQKLEFLYDLLVDGFAGLKKDLIFLIGHPDKIDNTNKFASLLSKLKEPDLIGPLLLQISLAGDTDLWLKDYLYAAINFLEDSSYDDEFDVPPTLVDKLASWVLDHTGERSWKAAGLLKYMQSPRAEQILLRKLEQRGDFLLTYVECVSGLLLHHRSKYIDLVTNIANDETRDIQLREFCRGIIDDRH